MHGLTPAAIGMTAPPVQNDFIQTFQVERSGVRGRITRLGPAITEVIARHDYPEPVARMLAEAMTLAALLASMLKFDGVFTLQTKGSGPISLLVADFRSPGQLRGYAAYDREQLARLGQVPGPQNPVPQLMGNGFLAFTVDQGEHTERYQGIVALEGATLAECAQNYFRQSEQIAAAFRLSVRNDGTNWQAGGIMIQRMPGEGGTLAADAGQSQAPDDDDWLEALTLLATTRDEELADATLPAEQLLWRLYHEPGIRVWPAHSVRHACTCSRERMERILRTFSLDEIRDMTVDGAVTVSCEFCNKAEEFDPASFSGS